MSSVKEMSRGIWTMSLGSSPSIKESPSGYIASPNLELENITEEKKLGKGGFGDVYLVRMDDTKLAMKKIDLKKVSRIRNQLAKNELKTLKKLDHPHIVAYKDGGVKDGFIYIFMEYCGGGDLFYCIRDQRNKGEPFEEKQLHNWVLQLCLALQYIHGRKILHRDIKPSNIFLTDSGTIKLGDFGLVRVLGEYSVLASTNVGTPGYKSPEVEKGDPCDAKADMWSLGCCLHDLATLKPGQQLKQMKELEDLNVNVEYKNLVKSLLEPDPSNRPEAKIALERPFLMRVMEEQLTMQEKKVQLEEDLAILEEFRAMREKHVQELRVQLEGREQQLLMQEKQVHDLRLQLEGREQQVLMQEKQVQDLRLQLEGREQQVLMQEKQLQDLTVQLEGREQQVLMQEKQVQDLTVQLEGREQQLLMQEKQVQDLTVQLEGRKEQLAMWEEQLLKQEKQVQELRVQLEGVARYPGR